MRQRGRFQPGDGTKDSDRCGWEERARSSVGAGPPSSADSRARCQTPITSAARSLDTRLVLPAGISERRLSGAAQGRHRNTRQMAAADAGNCAVAAQSDSAAASTQAARPADVSVSRRNALVFSRSFVTSSSRKICGSAVSGTLSMNLETTDIASPARRRPCGGEEPREYESAKRPRSSAMQQLSSQNVTC